MEDDFATNLKLLCSTESSVSAICRQIGVNRQQFSKYLSGAARPSPANLRKIATHFGVRPAEFHLPIDEFECHPSVAGKLAGPQRGSQQRGGFDAAFRGQTIPLRRYLGYYLSYFLTETWENSIICAIVRLDEFDGMVRSRSFERSVDPDDGSLYLSKYEGRVAMLGNRIFVLEYQSLARDALVETVLYPVGRGQLQYLRGTTFGITSRQRTPFTSPIVWRYLDEFDSLRDVMRKVGRYDINSAKLDPRARSILLGSHTKASD
ncbi:helix-turn-helix transcriptional regulator [Ruegeria pomeroyi]|uniref:Helix-turn-helix domain-containing protein n=1 Tax=Ruegeria alba TaxID=2916756 RepID=A0ABS9P0X9_9RHOB|nr:helix-turn-helix transcriptional regulator [Ruegeria alba]MCE8514374.1 helix-turn-helix transcriptional regulator [Ruegeria pomeroyi]MCE8525485.1 helix-turn-helix transcriptional regulator [Ruegeria pomeroyi]MCE8531172.1 helix-turn-helix transcriptional regulator [Ruegeria pomeroyi]MCE8535388.1 helix-turn-helix transcriptional regulator [Ruegeria pomeroyi]MCE8548288.1 helix-turn-helix transcriptional regulator [Ruegeria pomeroyi]